ncbi:MAG: hypothetical protein ACRDJC_17685 [Thermomicrobiales bacterium]
MCGDDWRRTGFPNRSPRGFAENIPPIPAEHHQIAAQLGLDVLARAQALGATTEEANAEQSLQAIAS